MTRFVQIMFGCFVFSISIPGATAVRAEDSAAVKKLFADPPRQYTTAPLWVWNDMLTEDQVRGTLRMIQLQAHDARSSKAGARWSAAR